RYPIDASRCRIERMNGHSKSPDHLQVPTDTVADAERVHRAIRSQCDRPHGPAVRHDATWRWNVQDVRPAEANLAEFLLQELENHGAAFHVAGRTCCGRLRQRQYREPHP